MTHDELIQMKKGYIDVHCHVIPHIDDGARTTSQALRMIGIAYKNGIRTMVATPHYEVSRYDNNIEKIIKYYNKVKMLAKEKYPDFNIFLGNEVFYSYGVIDGLNEKRIFTLGETDYVLVEFSPNDSLEHIEKSLYELINGGYRPILAHVERYENVIKNHRNTERLVEMGVLSDNDITGRAKSMIADGNTTEVLVVNIKDVEIGGLSVQRHWIRSVRDGDRSQIVGKNVLLFYL